MYKKLKIHFIGIGGIGMSGIAEVLLNLGYPITGSDTKASPVTERLEKHGARIYYQHASENVMSADVVVYSSAVAKDNIERVTAERRGIPVIRRAEMLAELMRLKKFGIAVAGTHGKTTTTSLLAHILEQAGLDPTLVIGGKLNQLGSNAKLGRGDFMVVEADESDGSFLHLSPTLTVVTNIDFDHLENFRDPEHYISAFDEFANKVPFYGLCVICAEDPLAFKLAGKLSKRVHTYGFSRNFDWCAENIKHENATTQFDLVRAGKNWGRFEIHLMGRHNVLNALAAIAIAHDLEIDLAIVKNAIATFRGVGRRLECVYENANLAVFDDYGHHPTEIRATLHALKSAYPHKKLRVAFQPHRYSRLKFLFDDFVSSFDAADEVFLLPLYAAGENPIRGVSSQSLYEAMRAQHPSVRCLDSLNDADGVLLQNLNEAQIVLTLGAGDVTLLAKKLKSHLEKQTSTQFASTEHNEDEKSC